MKKLILPALLLSAFIAFTQESTASFIEVSGNAMRSVMADEYLFSVTVIPGEACQIPKKGRDWEKQLKDCKEENNKLVASRQSVLEAIAVSHAGKIDKRSDSKDKFGGQSRTYKFTCRTYSDYQDFAEKLKEIEGAFSVELDFGINKTQPQILEELTLKALANAKEKAEKMSAIFGRPLGPVYQIYEDEPITSGNGEIFNTLMQAEMSRKSNNPFGSQNLPNEKGELFFNKTVYVRFFL